LLTELKALEGFRKGNFIEAGNWAIMPGDEKPVFGVSRACADVLTAEA